MRASSFVLSAVIASLSNGAVFGAPFLLKKPHAAAPVGIVSRPTVPPVSETERVELDVRHTIEPAPEPESLPAQPKPIAITRKAAETSRQGVPAAVAAPPFAVLVSTRTDELPICRRGGPEGPGIAEVVFLPEGKANVKLSEPYANTETGACIARRLGRDARPYEGEPVAVRVRFSL